MSQSDPNCISVKNGRCAQCSNRFYFNLEHICTPVHP